MKRKNGWKQLMILVLAGMLVWPAGAAGTDPYAGAETQLHTVPEGWIGVYTAEDLQGIRWNLDGNYILMNDIAIPDALYEEGALFADGFVPIGKKGYPGVLTEYDSDVMQITRSGAFTGIFDGNGYEISNLHITNPNGNSAGLFGACETEYRLEDHSRWETTFLENGQYIREDKSRLNKPGLQYRFTATPTGGVIRNLGITDSSVKITVDHTSFLGVDGAKYNTKGTYDSLYVGMIAGYADAVMDCYIHNVEIRVEMTGEYDAPHTGNEIAVGGLAGKTIRTESCSAVDTDVHMVNNCAYTDMQLYVGGVYGISQNAEDVQYTGTVNGRAGKSGTVEGLPVFLPDAVMEELCWRVLCREYSMDFDREAVKGMTPREMQNYAVSQTGIKLSSQSGYLTDYWRLIRYDGVCMHPCYRTAEETETGYMLQAQLVSQRSMEGMIRRLFTAEEWETLCQKHGIPAGALGADEQETEQPVQQNIPRLPIRRRKG